MKFAFMSFSCPEPDFSGCLSLVRRLGYDGFEPRVGAKHGHGIELELSKDDRANRRREAADAGIALCCLATGCSFANPATVEAEKASARGYIQLASDLGIPRMRVFGGLMGEGVDRDRATELVASSLREVAPLASDLGVTLCMETHDDWCHPGDLAAVMERVGHPAVGVTWDMMHPVLFGGVTMETAFQRLRPWIRHTHIHDGGAAQSPIEFKPCGDGIFDIPAFFRCLREMNYEGFVSGEWIDCADTIDLASELAHFRRLAAVRPGGCRTHGRMEIVSREINLPDSCTVKSLTERYEKMWADPAHAQPLVTFAFVPDASVDRRAVLDDPAAMLDMALGVLEKNLSVPNDFIPMVRVEMGTVTVATAFGTEIMMNRNSPPAVLTHPIQSREDLEKAGRPDFRVAGLFPKAFEHIAYFREHLPEGVRQCHVDLQGPWNTAQLLGGNEIFLQTYDDPEFVGQMIDRVGEVMIAAVPEIKKAIGEEADCFYLQGLKFQGGCRACNCSTDMISGDYYEEWVLPQDIRYFNAVVGGMIHICGNNSHCIRHFNKISNLHALEVAFNSLDIFKVADMLREDIVLVCTGPVEPPLLTPLGRETLEKLSRGILPDKKNLLFHFNDPADIEKCRTLYDGIYGAAR